MYYAYIINLTALSIMLLFNVIFFVRVKYNNNRNDASPQPNRTHTRVESTSRTTHQRIVSRVKNFHQLMNQGHHAHRLSPTQAAPGHVSGVLAMGMEKVKPENPELRSKYQYFLSNGLFFDFLRVDSYSISNLINC